MADGTLALKLYRGGLSALRPAARLLLWERARRGKEVPARLAERRGRASLARPEGPLIWLHGASVGEIVSLVPLAGAVLSRGFAVLLTSGTVTSAAVAAERMPAGVIHQFVPLDIPAYVDRFLGHWRPDLVLFAESELWPNMILGARRIGAPVLIVNGRMSDRSFARWRRMPQAAAALLGGVDQCLAQSSADAERFTDLGVERVEPVGNLKFDVPPPPVDPGLLDAFARLTAGRPVVVAASTHPGEDEAIAAAHEIARQHLPDLLTIAVPRHPERGEAAARAAERRGMVVGRRSNGAVPERSAEFYVADTIGELGLFYRLARVVFMGGSLVRHGGQNPIEAAKLGAPILHGPHVDNFRDIYGMLDSARGSFTIDSAEALGRATAALAADPRAHEATAQAAAETVRRLGGALPRTLAMLEPYFIQLRLS